MVSGFGMCCGYYQKIIDQKISVEDFYKKRYIKIWPYFALLCALDFVISPSKESLFEVFANLTLCQGLLPNAKISVIGVSWTLAVIFVFYMLFPFFCFLIGNKKRYIYYQCSGSKQNKGSCTSHNLRDEKLYNIVRNALQMQIQSRRCDALVAECGGNLY